MVGVLESVIVVVKVESPVVVSVVVVVGLESGGGVVEVKYVVVASFVVAVQA